MLMTHSKTRNRHNIIKLLSQRMVNQRYRKRSMNIEIVLTEYTKIVYRIYK